MFANSPYRNSDVAIILSQQCNNFDLSPSADCITYTYHSYHLVVQVKVVLDQGRSFFVMLSSLFISEIN